MTDFTATNHDFRSLSFLNKYSSKKTGSSENLTNNFNGRNNKQASANFPNQQVDISSTNLGRVSSPLSSAI